MGLLPYTNHPKPTWFTFELLCLSQQWREEDKPLLGFLSFPHRKSLMGSPQVDEASDTEEGCIFLEHLLYACQECRISSHLVLIPLLWRAQTLMSQSRKSELRERMKFAQGCPAGRKEGLDLCCLQTGSDHIKDMKSHLIRKRTGMASYTKQQL